MRASWTIVTAVALASQPALAINEIKIGAAAALPQANVGKAYSFTFTATGGAAPYQWALVLPVSRSPLGANWALSTDGKLTGNPVAQLDGDGNPLPSYVEGFRVVVTIGGGNSGQGSFEVEIVDAATAPSIVTRTPLLPGVVGHPYSVALRAGAGTAPFTWSVATGAGPDGLALGTDGLLSGTPTAAKSYTFTAQVKDTGGRTATGAISLTVDDALPLEFTLDATKTLRAATPRIGTNVNQTPEYWDDAGYTNQYLRNPGLEPGHPRRMYRAWTGSANTVEEWDNAQYDTIVELQTGFWDGGRYWIQSGPAKGRQGSITKYERIADAATPFGWRGVWTLADSDPTKVVQTLTDPKADFGKQDIFMVESAGTRTTDKFGSRPPEWDLYTGYGLTENDVTVSLDTAVKAHGSQSAKIALKVDGAAGVWQLVLWDNPLRRLRPDTRYHFSAMVRQSGVAGGQVTVKLAGPWGGKDVAVQKSTVADDGQFHLIEGEVGGSGEAQLGFYVFIENAGTLWVDDALLYEAQSTTTPAHGPASAGQTADAFAPLPFIAADLRELRIGTLRFWYYDADLTLDEALGNPTRGDPTAGNHAILLDLTLAAAVGAKPWIIAAKEWTPEEMVQLVEYLASTDTSQGMGALRASQGHPEPWTKTFGHIYIEYSNEAWNWPSYAYPFDLWHPELYSGFAKERFAAMKASPAFDASALTLIANGQVGDDFWVNDPVEAQTYPEADALDNAPYLSSVLTLPWVDGARQMVGWDRGTSDAMTGTMDLWKKRGHATRLLVYEGGPGPAMWNPSMDEEARHSSVFFASLFADSVADLFQNGVDVYNQFVYQNAIAWKAESGQSSRLRHPTGYAIAMFNEAAGDLDQIGVTPGGSQPKLTPLLGDPLADGTPEGALTCRAYHDATHLGLVLVNRNIQASYAVVVHTGSASHAFQVKTLGADDPMRGGLEGPGLVGWGGDSVASVAVDKLYEAVQPVTSHASSDPSGDLPLTIGPGAMVTAVLAGNVQPGPDAGVAGPDSGTIAKTDSGSPQPGADASVVVPTDAGALDGALAQTDAAMARPDGAIIGTDSGSVAGTDASKTDAVSSGCGCSTASSDLGGTLLALLASLRMLPRRRR